MGMGEQGAHCGLSGSSGLIARDPLLGKLGCTRACPATGNPEAKTWSYKSPCAALSFFFLSSSLTVIHLVNPTPVTL